MNMFCWVSIPLIFWRRCLVRQGSGGTYFINVQQCLEKLAIQKTKLLLQVNVDIDSLNVETGHSSDNCKYLMNDNAIDVFNNLAVLEKSLPLEVRETHYLYCWLHHPQGFSRY